MKCQTARETSWMNFSGGNLMDELRGAFASLFNSEADAFERAEVERP